MEKQQSRTFNSIMNSIYGIAASFVTVVLNFVVRVVLVHQLGEEINGLHNLFQNVANVMVLMELGISSAMVIHLYEPIKNKDTKMICGIMAFYKKVYSIIAVIFTVMSLVITFVLIENIVTTTISINLVKLYFLIFSFSFTINYLTYYKRSLLFAEQKNRVSMCVTAVCEVVFRSAQIVLLVCFHKYIIFLVLTIAEKLISNVICSIYVNKQHPYLKNTKQNELSKQKRNAIFDTVKPLVVNQVANTVQQSSKSIIISALLGNISIVGYYGNYQLVMSVAELVYSQFGGAFTSSFGNLAVDGDKHRMKKAYKKSAFVMNWIACIVCAGFLCCVQDFIALVFGNGFVLDIGIVIILMLNLGIYLLNIPVISIQNAMGLHRIDAKYMVIQAVLAIALGFGFGKIWGMSGIFIGLLIPLVIFTFIRKGIVICNYAVNMSANEYVKYILYELFKLVLTSAVAFYVVSLYNINPSIISVLLKGITAVVIGVAITAVLEIKNPILYEILKLVKKVIK